MESIQKLKDLVKWIEDCPETELSYIIEKLEEYKEGLFSYSKFKVGELVKLTLTPNISEKENWGWLGYKDYLVKGAIGKVADVDYYKGFFRYGLLFGNIGGGIFTFWENALGKTND